MVKRMQHIGTFLRNEIGLSLVTNVPDVWLLVNPSFRKSFS